VRLAQTIGNLLHNAVKFTPAGESVVVSSNVVEGAAEIRVRDTGVGIDPAEVERIFEPFAQGAQTLARTAGGLGLGLALAKGLVELQGGSVRARSGGAGRGSEFVVTLPLSTGALRATAEPRAAAAAGRRRVLVVEDSADAARSLADVLELGGHEVDLASDGATGLALAIERRPDVVLCDIGLPDMEGYEVARRLRADAAFEGTRLVALTGYAQAEDRQRALDAGFDFHVPKPPRLEVLEEILAGAAPSPTRTSLRVPPDPTGREGRCVRATDPT
jgi:CheY-like chemotaxis protein